MANYSAQDDIFSSSNFLSASSKKSPVKAVNARKSSASLRGAPVLANGTSDDAPNGRHHSLAHELAVALMPEPTAGSKLLAEEFGIEFDEGAEGIDEEDEDGVSTHPSEHISEADHDVQFGAHQHQLNSDIPSFADEFAAHHHHNDYHQGPSFEDEISSMAATEEDTQHDLDPVFNSPSIKRQRTRQRTPEKDAMIVLSENVEFADKFLTQLRTLDTDPTATGRGSSSQQPMLERLASDIVRRINETAREREGQVRQLFDCEREFKKISGEVNGADALGNLDELEQIEDLTDPPPSSSNLNQTLRVESRQLHTLEEEPSSPAAHNLSNPYNDWELDPDRNHLGDADPDYDASPPTSPVKDSFPPPPQLAGPVTPAKVLVHLSHIRTVTTTVVSSLSSISEHAQVTGVATTDAGRKIRSLKNKLGDLKTEWENAEKSKARIERWEAGISETDENKSVLLSPSRPSKRIDGRKIVQEHLQAFEQALVEAALKTQAIMARSA
ncbi:hypothetical protein CC1G_08996 [Coprinopsis cinerea okayama7|uniref:Uncharacterized protein n=1 Tax=Coprinopsis cinerea (strain Okayama-7 / 130 / ATCC MYA-4618 / FGSC 9003) TaxID=240176 RepID=A8N9G1_COPC7|nr:hypothetical protein CC1G_08996 [Coprinopsis cinerea okayama7\|eukprot:XP_001831467.1 hypothetical protein CC1G_08996 [Coprinopsis cinerea okayama7\